MPRTSGQSRRMRRAAARAGGPAPPGGGDLASVFASFSGQGPGGQGSLPVMYAKYLDLRRSATRAAGHLEHFAKVCRGRAAGGDRVAAGAAEALADEAAALRAATAAEFAAPDLPACYPPGLEDLHHAVPAGYGRVTPAHRAAFDRAYAAVKAGTVTRTLVAVDRALAITGVAPWIADPAALRGGFLTRAGAAPLSPLPAGDVDFRLLYLAAETEADRETVLLVLHLLHSRGAEYARRLTDLDSDPEVLHAQIVCALKAVEGQVSGGRRMDAFRLIYESMDSFRDNLAKYNREAVITGNSATILENFVSEVSSRNAESPKLAREFRLILAKLQRLSRQAGANDAAPVMRIINQASALHEEHGAGLGDDPDDGGDGGGAEPPAGPAEPPADPAAEAAASAAAAAAHDAAAAEALRVETEAAAAADAAAAAALGELSPAQRKSRRKARRKARRAAEAALGVAPPATPSPLELLNQFLQQTPSPTPSPTA